MFGFELVIFPKKYKMLLYACMMIESNLAFPDRKPISDLKPSLASDFENPFSAEQSGYGRLSNGAFISIYPPDTEMFAFHHSAHQYVADYVLDRSMREGRRFPCVFGQAAFLTEQYSFSAYDDISDPLTVEGVLHDIVRSQQEFEIPANPPRKQRIFRSTLTAFRKPEIRDELHSAEVLYELLGQMHEINSRHFDWREGYSSDPESPDFGYSVGNSAHFLAYFHPQAFVPARQSEVQFVVFNSHDVVYEYKNYKGMEDHARKKAEIRRRQAQPIHPYLGDHGTTPDWVQYALLSPDPATEAKERIIRRAILGDQPFCSHNKGIE